MEIRFIFSAIIPVMLCILVAAGLTSFTTARGRIHFLARAALALFITFLIAHVNRWARLWHGHEFFPSGHETFLLSVSTSLFLLRARSLYLTLPLALVYGIGLVYFGYHIPMDVIGAALLSPPVTLLCHSRGRNSKDHPACQADRPS